MVRSHPGYPSPARFEAKSCDKKRPVFIAHDSPFCYHLHSDLSNCVTNIDSITKFQQYVDRAKELGMKALAFSEHGSIMEWYNKIKAIETPV